MSIDVKNIDEYAHNNTMVVTIAITGLDRKDSINKHYFYITNLPEPMHYLLKTNKIRNFNQFREIVSYAYKTVPITKVQEATEQERKRNLEKIREIKDLLQ